MSEKVLHFYESLADHYHLIFDDWDRTIERQAETLNRLLASEIPTHPLKILDCSCGIGTQAIGFAKMGHRVVASDFSPSAIARAEHEARNRSLNISFQVSDMASLAEIADSNFDVVAALDNALPHLSADRLKDTAREVASRLTPDGLFIASIRDYDELLAQRPAIQEPAFYGSREKRRIVHQV